MRPTDERGNGGVMRIIFCGIFILLIGGCATVPEPTVESAAAWGSNPEYARASYAETIDYLSKGRQKDAEYLVDDALTVAPDSQQLHFLSGVLFLSRFENRAAQTEFAKAFKLDPDSDLAELSRSVVAMDQGLAVENGFDTLEERIKADPTDMLLRWLYGIEARRHGWRVEEGGKQFRAILKAWDIAPVMVHQTYAKLLTTDLGKPEKALDHRLLAVELEPEPFTYQGLANTYKALKRYDDADMVYGKLLETHPYNAIYWIQWGTCRFYMSEYADAAMLFRQSTLLNPKDVSPLIFEGRCLEKMGEPEQGYAIYMKALKQSPGHPQAKAYAAQAKLYGYGTPADFEAALEICRLPGRPAIDQLREMVRFADESENPIAPESSAELMPKMMQQAKEGDAAAGYSLGMIHRYGIGVVANEDAAMEWFARAAANGHQIAQREINPPE